MDIPKYVNWKAATHQSRFGFQTGEFKKLDSALKQYDGAPSEITKTALKAALNAWISKEAGFDWKNSLRNQTGIVGDLYTALNPYRVAPAGWVAPALPTEPEPGQVYLAQSFECAKSLARVNVPKAFERARLLINSAYRGIAEASAAGSRGRQIYERWFGAYDEGRRQIVRRNINAVHGALNLKGVVLYYRGKDAQGPNDCPAEAGPLAEGDYFGAAWTPSNLPAALDKKFTYIFLGSAFFASGEFGLDSMGGVIIHELTHAICGTDDVVFKGQTCYGADLCKKLAVAKPEKAINNADSYEFFCEAYQSAHYIPPVRALNLPPKASIALNMRAPV